jgi:hypothetical protein
MIRIIEFFNGEKLPEGATSAITSRVVTQIRVSATFFLAKILEEKGKLEDLLEKELKEIQGLLHQHDLLVLEVVEEPL